MVHALLERGWPPGLTNSMAASINAFPVRYVIVDNSGSMQSTDGQRLVKAPGSELWKSIACTRWAELGDVVMEIGNVVTRLQAETHFHLLNPTPIGQYFSIACPEEAQKSDVSLGRAGQPVDLTVLKSAMETSPTGSTPLTEAVQLVIRCIEPAAEQLRANGQQAVVIIASDGLPNEPATFLQALQLLQRLPVWLVVRLCTDEEEVVEYWDELDRQLEAPLETLDDVRGEALEVHKLNPWLTYAPSLHLARTVGMQDKLFDLLDEAALLPTQVRQLIERIVGCGELSEPEVEPEAFMSQVRQAVTALPAVYNPVSGKMTPWVDVTMLQRHLRRHSPAFRSSGKSSQCSVM